MDVEGKHAHPERLRDGDDVAADPARADDAERLAAQFEGARARIRQLAVGRGLAGDLAQPPRQGEDQGEGVLGHGVFAVAGHVCHGHPALAAGVEVDVLRRRRTRRDQAQGRMRFEKGRSTEEWMKTESTAALGPTFRAWKRNAPPDRPGPS